MRAAGFVLVGGSSRRMGRDKALLRVGQASLVEDIATKVRATAGSVTLVGAPTRYRALAFERLPDLRLGCGPLGGIEAALASGRGEWNLIVACDMPGIDAVVLAQLIAFAQSCDAPCSVTRDANGVIHPLCAVYRAGCESVVRKALDDGQFKVMDLIDKLRAAVFQADAVLPNVNTQCEWESWQKIHSRTTSNSGM